MSRRSSRDGNSSNEAAGLSSNEVELHRVGAMGATRAVDAVADERDAEGRVTGPLIVTFSPEERDEAENMMRSALEYWAGRHKRQKRDWYNAMYINVGAIVLMIMVLYVAYSNYVEPVLDLHTWTKTENCRIEGQKLDFVVSIRSFYAIPVLEVSYPIGKASSRRAVAFATASVTGVTGMGGSSDFLSSAADGSYRTCWVNPRNAYRVALSIDEQTGTVVILLIVVLTLLTLLQLFTLVQTWRTGEIRTCICCSRESQLRHQGYGIV